MTKSDMMIEAAKQYLLMHNQEEAHKSIIDMYNSIQPLPRGYKMTYTDAWCAAFVSAVAQLTMNTDAAYPECSCYYMVKRYIEEGRFVEDDAAAPQPGWIIFYDWEDSGVGDCAGVPDHVGIVTDVIGNTVKVIEGNNGGKVNTRNIEVDARYIRGYGVPKYDDTVVTVLDEPPKEPTIDEDYRALQTYISNACDEIMDELTTFWAIVKQHLK